VVQQAPPSPTVESFSGRLRFTGLLGRSQSPSLGPFHQRARSKAPSLPRHYPASSLLWASPTSSAARSAPRGVPVLFLSRNIHNPGIDSAAVMGVPAIVLPASGV
jgi:hypothetical protein